MERVSYEIAKLAVNFGWDGVSDAYYDTLKGLRSYDNSIGIIPDIDCWAPYQAELCDWLRKEKGILLYVDVDYYTPLNAQAYFCGMTVISSGVGNPLMSNKYYLTYEQALEEGLKEVFINYDDLIE